MIRDELRHIRHSLGSASNLEKIAFSALVFIALMIIGGLTYLAPVGTEFKIALFVFTIFALLFIGFCIYRHQLNHSAHEDDTTEEAAQPADGDNAEDSAKEVSQPIIPERPANPPTISAEKSIDDARSEDFEITDDDVIMKHKEENPSLYRRPFSIKPVIFKMIVAAAFWTGILMGAITQANQTVWGVFVGMTIVIPIYYYYLVLRWKGEEFVVNDTWFERPLTMPFPFPSRTPAIRRSEIGKYEFKQTTLDKLLGTCRLYSDTPSPDDKSFHNVKWLTHPAELRRATGISAPRKNSWLSPFRKNKE
jgi:hypothetical protein